MRDFKVWTRIVSTFGFALPACLSWAQSFPVAVNDSYAATPGYTLNVNVPGVLSNDVYQAGTIVVLVKTTAHGVLTLNNKGNFSYVPDAKFIGPDFFEYELLDSSGNVSNVAIDSIAVGAVNNLYFDSPSVFGGSTAAFNGHVSLNFIAPASGANVFLTSSNPAVAQVPTSITVAQGQTRGAFPITTHPVATTTQCVISANCNGFVFTQTLTVLAPAPKAVSFSNVRPTGGDGTALTGTVTLQGPAATGGAAISLSSSIPKVAAVPAGVSVPAGQVSATFPITDSIVSATTSVVITATGNGGSASNTINVVPYTFSWKVVGSSSLPPTIYSSPAVIGCYDPNGTYNTAAFTLTLSSQAPAGGLVVALNTYSPVGGMVCPSSVTIPAGTKSVTINASETAETQTQTIAYVIASYLSQSTEGGVYVYPPKFSLYLYNDSYEFGGDRFPGGAAFFGLAPPGGANVLLKSNSASVTVPPQVLIEQGEDFAPFDISSKPVASPIAVTITGTTLGQTATMSFALLPAQVSDLIFDSDAIKGGTSTQATIYLNGVAPPGGALIHLDSSPSGIVSASTVVVPAGKSSITFTLSSKAVTSTTLIQIHAYTWAGAGWGAYEDIEIDP